jgi:hypothetical protein
MPKSLKVAFGELVVSAVPSNTPVNKTFQIYYGADGLIILYYFDNGFWEGRCISPQIGTGAPTFAALCDRHRYIDTTANTLYMSVLTGSTAWLTINGTGGSGGGGC